MNSAPIYLASRSPRRRELLQQIAVEFLVIEADIDESVLPGEVALDYVKRIAFEKAQAGVKSLSSDDLTFVLAADTAVIVRGEIFGKPVNDDDARHMLKLLSGETHQVMTAIVLANHTQTFIDVSISQVRFGTMTNSDIDWYVSTGEGQDKAGGYAVQGLGAIFIEEIRGSYSGIMGLPIRETAQLLKQMDSQCEQ